MQKHGKIDYIEFPSSNLNATKSFFTRVFGWSFQDFGPDYASFLPADAGLGGGFFKSELKGSTANGGALIVIYSRNLEQTKSEIVDAGGLIVKEIFPFPGGDFTLQNQAEMNLQFGQTMNQNPEHYGIQI